MPPAATPLTRELILATAEKVIRRHGPEKATIVDVARVLGVSHAAIYRHIATKAELRSLVMARWMESTMPPLRAVVAMQEPAAQRLRSLFDELVALKRRRLMEDPELFSAYRTLAADAQDVVIAHVEELIHLGTRIIQDGVEDGSLRQVNADTTSRAIFMATSRFHHPAHAAEWDTPGLDAAYASLWELLLDGLRKPD